MSRFFKHDAAVKAAKESLTKEQKELLKQFDDTLKLDGKSSPKVHKWVQKVKTFFDDMKF